MKRSNGALEPTASAVAHLKAGQTFMKRVLTFLLLSAIAQAGESSPRISLAELPGIGAVLSNLPDSRISTLVNSGTMAPTYDTKIKGIDYIVAVSREKHEVLFVSTESQKFRTPDGFSMASSFREILARFPQGKRHEEGWGTYVLLPSGWGAFWTIQGPEDLELRPRFFFRRERN